MVKDREDGRNGETRTEGDGKWYTDRGERVEWAMGQREREARG